MPVPVRKGKPRCLLGLGETQGNIDPKHSKTEGVSTRLSRLLPIRLSEAP